jgi:hypothetical protein
MVTDISLVEEDILALGISTAADWGRCMRGRRDLGIRSGYPATAIIAGESRNLSFSQEPILTRKLSLRLSVGEMLRL